MSLLPGLTMRDVLDRFHADWWVGLTDHIKCDEIARHPELRWDWHAVSRSRHLNMEFVVKHADLPDLTMRLVRDNPNVPWDEGRLSYMIP